MIKGCPELRAELERLTNPPGGADAVRLDDQITEVARAPLARLQAKVVLEEVSARLPDLRLVPGVKLEFAPNVSFRGPLSLPVEWGPESNR